MVRLATHPRLIKTHLHSLYFKRQLGNRSSCPKFIVVQRDPKDVLISYYYFHRSWAGNAAFPGTWNDFFEKFKRKTLDYGDYFEHALSWSRYQYHPNVLIVKYDDMKRVPLAAIRNVANFLDVSCSDEVISEIAEETSFDAMKRRQHTKSSSLPTTFNPDFPFFRKGINGSWKEDLFTKDQVKYVDDITDKYREVFGLSFV